MTISFAGVGVHGELSALPDRIDAVTPDRGINGIGFVDFRFLSPNGYGTHNVAGIHVGTCEVDSETRIRFGGDSRNTEIDRNAVVLRGPDEIGWTSWEGHYRGRFMSMTPAAIERVFQQPLTRIDVSSGVEDVSTRLPVAHLLAALSCATADPARADPLIVESIALAVLRACGIGPVEADRRSPVLTAHQSERVRALIAERLCGPLSLRDMARTVDLSESYFVRAFKGSFGVTPYRYVLRERVAYAEALIQAGNRSLTEIAAMAGFPDAGRMGRTFRSLTGRSPTRSSKPKRA